MFRSTTLATVREVLASVGGQLRHTPLHGKMLVIERVALIGSYNLLAADPYGTAERSRDELSVEISHWAGSSSDLASGPLRIARRLRPIPK